MNKHLIVIGVVIILLAVSISGCTNLESTSESSEDDDNFWNEEDNGFWDDSDEDEDDDGGDWGDTETIMVSGIDTQRTINYLDKPVKLMVSGLRNDVTVTKETNLVDIILSGVDCVVRVSRNHSFTSTTSGVGSEIVYYD